MNTTTSVCIIAGSTRSGSSSATVAKAAARAYADLGTSVSLIDLRDFPEAAMSHKDIHDPPESFQVFAKPCLEADALVVIVPEYNGGIPGVLKSFIDLLPFPEALHHRPVAFVGVAAGSWGGLRPIEQLTTVFMYRQAFVYPGHLFIRDCEDALDVSAGTITNQGIQGRLIQQCAEFVRFTSALKSLRS